MRSAFEYARDNGRRKVTAAHKANIMKFSDGLFLRTAQEVAKGYPDIEFEDRIIDNLCNQLVSRPEEYDMIVLPNLYGDIVSDLGAGMIGGLGLAPGGNIGDEYAVFEATHGSAPKYKGMNKVNPMALMLSGVMMLRHLRRAEAADRVESAIAAVIAEGKSVTYDMKPSRDDPTAVGTSDVADAIIEKMKWASRASTPAPCTADAYAEWKPPPRRRILRPTLKLGGDPVQVVRAGFSPLRESLMSDARVGLDQVERLVGTRSAGSAARAVVRRVVDRRAVTCRGWSCGSCFPAAVRPGVPRFLLRAVARPAAPTHDAADRRLELVERLVQLSRASGIPHAAVEAPLSPCLYLPALNLVRNVRRRHLCTSASVWELKSGTRTAASPSYSDPPWYRKRR